MAQNLTLVLPDKRHCQIAFKKIHLHPMSNFYLVNSKPDEPNFPLSCAEAAAEHGFSFKSISINNLSYFADRGSDDLIIYDGTEVLPADSSDLFFVRTRKPMVGGTALLNYVLNAKGCVFNDKTNSLEHQIITSKMTQPFVLKQADIHFPSTLVTVTKNVPNIRPLIDKHFIFPLVVKLTGSKGEQVWKCDNEEELNERLGEIGSETNKLIQFQEYIPNTFDIRVIVLYDQIIGAIARSSTDGFYNNVSKGGSAEKIEITDEEMRISLEATRLTKLELSGIDIVRTEHGPLLFEVNKSPDIEAFCDASGIDLVKLITDKFIETNTTK